MTDQEIDHFLKSLPLNSHWRLSQCLYNEKALQLHFEKGSDYLWLSFSIRPGHPYIFSSKERVFLIKSLKKPLNLFIKTHLLGKSFVSAHREIELGRVIHLQFEEDAYLQLNLIPGRINIEVGAGGKKLTAFKPKDIPEVSGGNESKVRPELREPSVFKVLWQSQLNKKKTSADSEKELLKDLKKKQKGLEKMKEKLSELEADPWGEAGEKLKSFQSLEQVPADLQKYVDPEKSLPSSIDHCFQQSKKNRLKIEGTLTRIQSLEEEIEKLQRGEKRSSASKKTESLFKKADTKGRTHDLGDFRLYIGKSAKDNLALLRKAKPWYLWLHIKDYPGAHGIIERSKNAKIDQKTMEKAALLVIQQSLPSTAQGRYEAVYTECRYVRPIKGAKSGQVTHSREKVLGVQVK